jgi:hypothetical protein
VREDAPVEAEDLLTCIKAYLDLDAMEARSRLPPPPLFVPAWAVAMADAEGVDLDAEARRFGFDGYCTYDAVSSTASGAPQRQPG